MSTGGLVLVILLCCFGQLDAQLSTLTNHSELDQQMVNQLRQLLIMLRFKQPFNNLLIYGPECIFHSVLPHLSTSSVLAQAGSTDYDWNFGSLTLILSCGSNGEMELNNRTFLQLQTTRRLIYLDEEKEPEIVCAIYFAREQFNVALLFGGRSLIYACRYFQSPNYEELELNSSADIFIQQFLNMKGAIIRTEADELPPRSIFYNDENTGQLKMIGYVANLVNNFARKVNATLQLRSEVMNSSRTTYFPDIEKWTEEDQLDIGASLGPTFKKTNMDLLTYPYLMTSYCFMVPIPSKLPYNQIYTVIVGPLILGIIFIILCLFSLLLIYTQKMSWQDLSLSNILLNDQSIRGLLGQSFPLSTNPSKLLKFIVFIICFASIMMTTMYVSYLQSYFTQPPSEPAIRSYEDVGDSRYLILTTRRELNLMLTSVNVTWKADRPDRGKIIEDWNEFTNTRDSFNSSYIYPVTLVRWKTYQEQQKLFTEPVFYYSEDICLNRFLFLCILVRRHLPYRDLLEEHILRTQEFGLMWFWIERGFFEMVRFKIIPLEDLSHPKPREESITLSDLSWIFELYLLALMFSCLCFICERWGWKWMHRIFNRNNFRRFKKLDRI